MTNNFYCENTKQLTDLLSEYEIISNVGDISKYNGIGHTIGFYLNDDNKGPFRINDLTSSVSTWSPVFTYEQVKERLSYYPKKNSVKFQAGDTIQLIDNKHPHFDAAPKAVLGNKYIVGHVGMYDYGQGEEPVVCITELYGGWLPAKAFIKASSEEEIKPKMSTPMFSVGEIVTQYQNIDGNNDSRGNIVGRIGRVKGFERSGIWSTHWLSLEKGTSACSAINYRAATTEEALAYSKGQEFLPKSTSSVMYKYKEGDRVSTPRGNGTVIGFATSSYLVEYDEKGKGHSGVTTLLSWGHHCSTDSAYFWTEKDLKLLVIEDIIPPKEKIYTHPEAKNLILPKDSQKFKIGDLVIGNDKATYSFSRQGWKGKVVKITEHGIVVKGEGNLNYNQEFSVEPDRFDLLEHGHPTPKWAPIPDGVTIIKDATPIDTLQDAGKYIHSAVIMKEPPKSKIIFVQ